MALRKAELENSGKGTQGITEWIVFFLRSMQRQKQTLEQKIKEELASQSMPALSLHIIELIRGRGLTSISEITAVTKANRNTVKLHLRNLVSDQAIVSEGFGRSVRYRLSGSF